MTLIITSCIIWIACGVLAYGATMAYFQREYPYYAKEQFAADHIFSLLMGLTGPVGLLLQFLEDGFEHGFMWRRR